MSVIKGYEGTITVSGVSVLWANSWEATIETEELSIGPFINDGGRTYSTTTSRTMTGSIEVTVPKNKDTGQGVLVTAVQDGNPRQIVLTTTLGYTITIPSGIITSFNMTQDAAESITASFDFKDSGGFTIS